MTKIKICGITNLDDAMLAVELGADALGFVFYPKSVRHVSVRTAADICHRLPPFVARVGVFVDELEYEIERALNECLLTALQFHGEEPPGFCAKFGAKSIKAIRLRDEDSLRLAATYDVDAILLDTYDAAAQGGTGKTSDWRLAVRAREFVRAPLILAGGLRADNVAEAIRIVRPYAVDVSSGVEREPGRKDPEKLRRFIESVRHAATEFGPE
ncbi:MAG: phosphoribosylanthranilate isomerase [Verrucomicrobiae bacterium]|nr:phosphoribosylanthranilate isomerase [Verrucomicrobiae bacterium]MDW8345076.1 phosphoribosylanthranilate isomerase [Verrucomicrobiae bacterium]